MNVVAISTPENTGWRWRIVNYAGEVIEESHATFRTIAIAVEDGARRLVQLNLVDRSVPPRLFRSTSHLRKQRSSIAS